MVIIYACFFFTYACYLVHILGFTIALQEYLLTIPTLWERTLEFVRDNPQYIYPRTRPDSLYNMITEDDGLSYNLCHFWSNFEVEGCQEYVDMV